MDIHHLHIWHQHYKHYIQCSRGSTRMSIYEYEQMELIHKRHSRGTTQVISAVGTHFYTSRSRERPWNGVFIANLGWLLPCNGAWAHSLIDKKAREIVAVRLSDVVGRWDIQADTASWRLDAMAWRLFIRVRTQFLYCHHSTLSPKQRHQGMRDSSNVI